MRLKFFSLLVVIVFLSAGGGYYSWQKFYLNSLDFQEIYEKVSSLIKERKYEEAYQNLLDISYKATEEIQWNKILKKAYDLSLESGNFSVLASFSARAISSLPNREQYWALRVYSALRTQAYSEAYAWSKNYLLSEKYRPLKKEALLMYFTEEKVNGINFSDKFEEQKDPSIFEEIGDVLDSASFYYNASLLYLLKGDVNSVHRIFDKISQKKIYTKAFAFLGYKIANWNWALENLNNLREEDRKDKQILVLLADINILKGDYNQAFNIYSQLRSEHPDFSIIPYINAALISLKSNNEHEAFEVLEKGSYYFKNNPDYSWFLALFLNNFKRKQEALDVLRPLIETNSKIELLFTYVENQEKSQQIRQSAFWDLWYRQEGKDRLELAEIMLFDFAKTENWHDFDLLIAQLDQKSLHKNNIAFLIGYKFFKSNDFDQAGKSFLKEIIFSSESAAMAYYNNGLLLFSQKDFLQALSFFQKSQDSLPNSNEYFSSSLRLSDKILLSKIFFFQGLSFFYEGNKEAAKKSLEKSLSYESQDFSHLSVFYNLFPYLKEN